MSDRPEQHVLDEIDALVNEQLEIGPVDDYNVNRYPDCNRCPHDWHGEECEWCSCEQSTGEVAAVAPRPWRPLHRPSRVQDGAALRRDLAFDIRIDGDGLTEEQWRALEGPGGDGGRYMPPSRRPEPAAFPVRRDGSGYTVTDLRALQDRDWRPHVYRGAPWVRFSEAGPRPRVRFTLAMGDHIATTTAEVLCTLTHWERNTALLELADVHQLFESAEGVGGEYPVVVLEVWRDDDWVGLSTIHRDQLTFRHDMEWGEGGQLLEDRWTAELPCEAWLVSDL